MSDECAAYKSGGAGKCRLCRFESSGAAAFLRAFAAPIRRKAPLSKRKSRAARRSRRHAHPPGFETAYSAEKREKSRREKSKSAAAPFPVLHGRNRRANALQAPFMEKRPRQSRQMRNRAAGFQRPFTACGERSGPQRRRKREKSRRGKSKSAAAPFPAPHSRKRRANAPQAPFREKRPRQSRQMRNSAAGFQRPFTACGAARPSEAACRTPAPRAPSSRRFDIRADWA